MPEKLVLGLCSALEVFFLNIMIRCVISRQGSQVIPNEAGALDHPFAICGSKGEKHIEVLSPIDRILLSWTKISLHEAYMGSSTGSANPTILGSTGLLFLCGKSSTVNPCHRQCSCTVDPVWWGIGCSLQSPLPLGEAIWPIWPAR